MHEAGLSVIFMIPCILNLKNSNFNVFNLTISNILYLKKQIQNIYKSQRMTERVVILFN